ESLPADYQGQGVYSSVLQLSDPSDPKWESFQGLARMYRDAAPGTRLGGIVDQDGVPTVLAQAPAGWTAGTVRNGVATPILDPPPGLVLLPTIAKVQMVFSLLARDVYHYPARGAPPGDEARERSAELHGPWGGNF